MTCAAFLALPRSNTTLFDGVPFSACAEAAALALTIPLLLSASLRRLFTRWLATRGRRIGAVTVAAVLAGIMCKGLLLTSGPFAFFRLLPIEADPTALRHLRVFVRESVLPTLPRHAATGRSISVTRTGIPFPSILFGSTSVPGWPAIDAAIACRSR